MGVKTEEEENRKGQRTGGTSAGDADVNLSLVLSFSEENEDGKNEGGGPHRDANANTQVTPPAREKHSIRTYWQKPNDIKSRSFKFNNSCMIY